MKVLDPELQKLWKELEAAWEHLVEGQYRIRIAADELVRIKNVIAAKARELK